MDNLHEWVRAEMETRLLVAVGLQIMEEIRKKVQSKYIDKIEIEDIRGIRDQEIAIKRGLA